MLILTAGMAVGIGIFTFSFADGVSYLSDNPAACANCHIMQPIYHSWQRSSHANAATCQDCHMSQATFEHYAQKISQGVRHAYVFTFDDSDISLRVSQADHRQIIRNCIRCHGDSFAKGSAAHTADSPQCLNCHKSVAH